MKICPRVWVAAKASPKFWSMGAAALTWGWPPIARSATAIAVQSFTQPHPVIYSFTFESAFHTGDRLFLCETSVKFVYAVIASLQCVWFRPGSDLRFWNSTHLKLFQLTFQLSWNLFFQLTSKFCDSLFDLGPNSLSIYSIPCSYSESKKSP